jgi:curved DNA-binding protein CbpA
MNNLSSLNNNPQEKIKYLQNLLNKPNLKQEQIVKIYKIIQQTQQQLNQTQQLNQFQQRQQPQNIVQSPRHKIQQQQINQQYNVNNKNQILANTNYNQYNTISSLEQNYNKTEEQFERELQQEIERKRRAFKSAQQKRWQEYQQKLSELKNNGVQALQVFGLKPNFNATELKKTYRKLAIQYHPDRPNGDNNKFQLITKCYLSLLEDLKTRADTNRTLDDVQQSREKFDSKLDANRKFMTEIYERQGNYKNKNGIRDEQTLEYQKLKPDPHSFNPTLFNKIYEENKLWDPNDEGYDDWLRNGPDDESTTQQGPKLFGDKFNLSVFNATFNDTKTKSKSGQIVEYDGPKEIISTSLGYTTLGNNNPIEDFSKHADQKSGIGYTDLKAAYTRDNTLININEVDISNRSKDIKSFKRDRANIKDLTPLELKRLEQQKMEQDYLEQQRANNQRQMDNLYEQHYSKIHSNILGFKPDVDKQISYNN